MTVKVTGPDLSYFVETQISMFSLGTSFQLARDSKEEQRWIVYVDPLLIVLHFILGVPRGKQQLLW